MIYMKVINRTEVIDYLKEYKDLFDWDDGGREKAVLTRALKDISNMPYTETHSFEWCTNCKEYNQDNHCCYRWSNVIRDTVEENREYLEQVKWERDLAVKQLEDLGYGLGEKPRVGRWVLKKELVPLPWDSDPLNWDNYDKDTHSEWKEFYHCSNCDWKSGDFKGGNYCRNCGVKMEDNKDE